MKERENSMGDGSKGSKMNQRERITSLLSLNKNDINYDSNLDMYLKRIRTIRKNLTLSDTTQIELILKWMMDRLHLFFLSN